MKAGVTNREQKRSTEPQSAYTKANPTARALAEEAAGTRADGESNAEGKGCEIEACACTMARIEGILWANRASIMWR